MLTRAECLELLESAQIGRIAYTDRALPAIVPVNFVLDGDHVVIRTGAGSKLAAATRNAVVAFEADAFDVEARSGWSVMVVGRSSVVDDPTETARLEQLPLKPWTPIERPHFVRIGLDVVSGRRIGLRAPGNGHLPVEQDADRPVT